MLKTIILLSVIISGCASYVETVRVDPDTLQANGDGINGVIYYEPKLVKVRYVFTQRIEKGKGVVGSADKKTCHPVIQKEEILTLPDYQNPRAILHKPSLFSSSDFGVTLNNGMLTSVTSKQTPQLPQLLEQINKAKEVGILSLDGVKDCNAGPIIDGHEIVNL